MNVPCTLLISHTTFTLLAFKSCLLPLECIDSREEHLSSLCITHVRLVCDKDTLGHVDWLDGTPQSVSCNRYDNHHSILMTTTSSQYTYDYHIITVHLWLPRHHNVLMTTISSQYTYNYNIITIYLWLPPHHHNILMNTTW